jgi:hypothetical protein
LNPHEPDLRKPVQLGPCWTLSHGISAGQNLKIVSEGDLNPEVRAFSPILRLSTQVGEKSPVRGVHANLLAGTPQPVSSGLARLRPQDRGRRHSLRRECRAPAKSAGALPVACGSRCAMQRPPRNADLCTGRPPRQADDTGVSTTAAGPESARDIHRSARTCHLFRPSAGPRRTGSSGALRSRTPWMTTSGPRAAVCGGRVVVPTLCVGN